MGSLVLNGATSGSTTLTPTDAVTATLTLPSTSGTVLTTTSPKTGNVIQVVQGTYSTETSTSSSTYSDTGLTASITPSSASNKILIIVSQDIGKATNDLSAQLQLVRNSTSLGLITNVYTASSSTFYSVNAGFTYLDSPSTTSSTTYKTQFRSSNGLASARICNSNTLATITLMEIAG
jgi:hypothetical protein